MILMWNNILCTGMPNIKIFEWIKKVHLPHWHSNLEHKLKLKPISHLEQKAKNWVEEVGQCGKDIKDVNVIMNADSPKPP